MLAWWQLRRGLPALKHRYQRALLPALVAWPVTGVFFGLAKGLSAGPAAGVLAGVLQGLDVALIIGSGYLFQSPACPTDPHALAPLGRLPPLIRTPAIAVLCGVGYAVASGLRNGIERGAMNGLKDGLTNWLVLTVLAGLAVASGLFTVSGEPTRISLRLPRHRRQLICALTPGAARRCAFGLIAGYGVKLAASLTGGRPLWLMGGLAGAAIGLGFALVSWARTAAPAARQPGPAQRCEPTGRSSSCCPSRSSLSSQSSISTLLGRVWLPGSAVLYRLDPSGDRGGPAPAAGLCRGDARRAAP